MKQFAKISEVNEGTEIVLDGGFTCCKDGDHRTVKSDGLKLYFDCDEGKHFLDGQEKGEVLVGIHLA